METNLNSENQIISNYMKYVLENGESPKSVFNFTKELNIEEREFYNHFSSFEQINRDIFIKFYSETIQLISKDEAYDSLDATNKLLIFYYTFFELLTANRSYVTLVLKDNKNILDKIKTLKGLREKFKNYIKTLNIETIDFKKQEINNFNENLVQELAWSQLLITLKFWLEDTSASFEKTDLFIEKSVHASFELLNVSSLKNVIDFGKFFFKEKIKPLI